MLWAVYDKDNNNTVVKDFKEESDAHDWNQYWGWDNTYVAPLKK